MITAIILALMFFVSGASLAQETVSDACSIVDAPMVSIDGDPLLLGWARDRARANSIRSGFGYREPGLSLRAAGVLSEGGSATAADRSRSLAGKGRTIYDADNAVRLRMQWPRLLERPGRRLLVFRQVGARASVSHRRPGRLPVSRQSFRCPAGLALRLGCIRVEVVGPSESRLGQLQAVGLPLARPVLQQLRPIQTGLRRCMEE